MPKIIINDFHIKFAVSQCLTTWKMGKIILDLETFDDLKIYFELDHLASQLGRQRKEKKLLDSFEAVSLSQYDDALFTVLRKTVKLSILLTALMKIL